RLRAARHQDGIMGVSSYGQSSFFFGMMAFRLAWELVHAERMNSGHHLMPCQRGSVSRVAR
ncbi:MAG: hypothetical protein OXC53_03815, partial [Rhodobacteraceae bacterium]|nr:hypothetical protein [Paracoccaceae bacterium]